MSLLSRLFATAYKLPQALTYDLIVEHDVMIPMDDGTHAYADIWTGKANKDVKTPVVLIRTPYRRGETAIVARLASERGYRVVLANCRGRYGSEGKWLPFHDEQMDGEATIRWINKQSWSDGRIYTLGASYQGFCQWALTVHPDENIRSMAIIQSDSDPRSIIYPNGILGLETVIAWLTILEGQKSTLLMLWGALFGERSHKKAYESVNLKDCDQLILGRSIDYYQQWLKNPYDSSYWDSLIPRPDDMLVPPILMVGGWYDLHVNGQIHDFSFMRAAGRHVRLIIGPWNHESMGITGYILREGFAWFAKYGKNETNDSEQPDGMRIYIMGRKQWLDLKEWPIKGETQSFYLHKDAILSPLAAEEETVRKYIYDPIKPTPSIGGNVTIIGKTAGVKTQVKREKRSDVLCYTTQKLKYPLCIIGNPEVKLWVSTNAETTDFFLRICDVKPSGKSLNVVDGMSRVIFKSSDKFKDNAIAQIVIQMNPTAYEFAAGHKIRLQVSSGAHPMYSRNFGTAASNDIKANYKQAEIKIYHGANHLSEIRLPVFIN
ncbi:MAG: CocE/NonD family hydrolase [Oscillospiraceae bacterium]|nr:CocE/NonD family hydrolase [Oscillospiraceae bacterium]